MPAITDGPCSPYFSPVPFKGNTTFDALRDGGLSPQMTQVIEQAPSSSCNCWGIPFEINDPVFLRDGPVSIELSPLKARWLVFMHTSDLRQVEPGLGGFFRPMRGEGQLGEVAARYSLLYEDGVEESREIRRRFHIGAFDHRWGENCFEAVHQGKPRPIRPPHEQPAPYWGSAQTRVDPFDYYPWMNWLWAWENPHPDQTITGIRFEPCSGVVVISAISAGDISSLPLRWEPRRKALLTLPEGETFQPTLDEHGLLRQIQLDLGQVISATPRLVYPNDRWAETYNNLQPVQSDREVLVEYTAHPEACFHFPGDKVVPAKDNGYAQDVNPLQPISPATQRVTLRVVEKETGKCVPVKLHIHGEAGEYLPPVDRHRLPNPAWFEDYSTDFIHGADWGGRVSNPHYCTYIPGETTIDLPPGKVYIEVSKGFEIRPVSKVVEVTAATEEITVEIERVLPWRQKGWVTADTHVHFLSPSTAMLEGAAEGVNVVNLLASQWGELMTNVGDFDGKTTWGARETGGDGEHLVRVGTENRQHVLGHISLLGYSGKIIAPMTTGGPDESAIGDPIEILLTEWARQCRQQGGVVVIPHFPNPRAEHAATIASGEADALEMTSWGNLYEGIDPYSLSDYYRYLNCGYLVAAVGGTDKMSANTAVGTVRTYARIPNGQPFTYESWKDAVRRAETFVTYGPLIEFSVEGRGPGGRIRMPDGGGTVGVSWQVASATIPVSRVELVVNGEIRESVAAQPWLAGGHWRVKVDDSAWMALLVRGHYPDRPEIIAAHTTPVMVNVEGSQLLAAADAVTILEQIEGALAYIDTVGTRASNLAYKRMRLELTSAHRSLHNRMHQMGFYHEHPLSMEH